MKTRLLLGPSTVATLPSYLVTPRQRYCTASWAALEIVPASGGSAFRRTLHRRWSVLDLTRSVLMRGRSLSFPSPSSPRSSCFRRYCIFCRSSVGVAEGIRRLSHRPGTIRLPTEAAEEREARRADSGRGKAVNGWPGVRK